MINFKAANAFVFDGVISKFVFIHVKFYLKFTRLPILSNILPLDGLPEANLTNSSNDSSFSFKVNVSYIYIKGELGTSMEKRRDQKKEKFRTNK